MRFYIGKAIEVVGISLLGFALMEGIFNEQHGMRNEYILLGIGSLVFYVGYLVERTGRSGGE